MTKNNLILTSSNIIKYGLHGLKKYVKTNPKISFFISLEEVSKLNNLEGLSKEEGFNGKNFLRALEFLDKKSVSNGVNQYEDDGLMFHVVEDKNFPSVKFKYNLEDFDEKNLKPIQNNKSSQFNGASIFLFLVFFVGVPVGINIWLKISLWILLPISFLHACIVYYFKFKKKRQNCYKMFGTIVGLNVIIYGVIIGIIGKDIWNYSYIFPFFILPVIFIVHMAFLGFMCMVFCVIGDDYRVEKS